MADKMKKKLLKHILSEMELDTDDPELEEMIENAESLDDFADIVDYLDESADFD